MKARITAVLLLVVLLVVSLTGAAISKPSKPPTLGGAAITSICYGSPDIVVGLKGVKTGMRLTVYTVVGGVEATEYVFPEVGTTSESVYVGETIPEFAEATLEKPARKGGWLFVDDFAANPHACSP